MREDANILSGGASNYISNIITATLGKNDEHEMIHEIRRLGDSDFG